MTNTSEISTAYQAAIRAASGGTARRTRKDLDDAGARARRAAARILQAARR